MTAIFVQNFVGFRIWFGQKSLKFTASQLLYENKNVATLHLSPVLLAKRRRLLQFLSGVTYLRAHRKKGEVDFTFWT